MQTDPRARVLSDFEGAWQLSRVIRHDDGTSADFAGEAVWTPEAEGLFYRETGNLSIPGGPKMQADRCYLWRDGLDVYFEDGRFFHRVPSAGGTARHWCDPDTYVVTYDFTAWPRFSTVWQVSGPRKAYEMTSHYQRR